MAAWLVVLLLAPDLSVELQKTGISRSGLSVLVGEVGKPAFFTVAAGTPRAPASNQKLVTAAAALELLGDDFEFRTTVAKGPHGALVVIGDGDPNLSGRFFGGDPTIVLRGMARDLRAKGITRVRELVLDGSRFDNGFVHPDWPKDQLDRWYCAPVAALVYNDSCWDITVRPGAAGRSVIEIQPSLLSPTVTNRCGTTSLRRQHLVHIGRDRFGTLAVRGKILDTSQGVTQNVTVRNPITFFGDAFYAALVAEHIAVGETRVGTLPGAEPVLQVTSSLARTVKVMLTNSQNLYAECVFKRLGEGSFESGAAAAKRALGRLEVPTADLLIRDGSGLARTNRVTARTLYGILQAMRDRDVFVNALASGGEGTLRRRYRDLGERVRAKTGTIRGVSALSGYVTGKSGKRYVFVLLCTGKSRGRARALQDRIVLRLARS